MALQKRIHLPQRKEVPLFGFVGRLTHQKGLDILLESIEPLMRMDIQIVVQGSGDAKYEKKFKEIPSKYKDKLGVCLVFNEDLAHQIYAGADFLLMPSHFEPCGLSQLISLKYGTIPIVYFTGGLADTIHSFDPATGQGNGFVFKDYSSRALVSSVERGVKLFTEKDHFPRLIKNAMLEDFSWNRSAQEYQKLYERIL